jgi:hypothetical protein
MALQESYTTIGAGENTPYEGYPIAQSFVTGLSYSISSVQLYLYRSGALTSATVEIQETTGGLPNGTVVVSKTIVGSVIPTSLGWVEFLFATTPTLTNGTTYAIVLSIIGSSEYVVWNYNYVDGEGLGHAYFDGTVWNVFPYAIALYQVYGEAGVTFIDLSGTVGGIGTLTGALVEKFSNLSGTVAGVGAMTGKLTKKFVNNNTATNSRLVVAGSNSIWYEDI